MNTRMEDLKMHNRSKKALKNIVRCIVLLPFTGKLIQQREKQIETKVLLKTKWKLFL